MDYRTKNKMIRYVCDRASRFKINSLEHKCNNSTMIREAEIEKYLLNNFKTLAIDFVGKNKVIKKQKSNVDEKKRKIKLKIQRLKDLYLDDLISKEDYKKDYIKYNKELEDLKQPEIIQKDYSYLENLLNQNIFEIYSTFNIEEKRKIWLKIIDKIYVKDGKIKEVTFL